MKKLLQGALLPFGLFAITLTLLGCNPAPETESSSSEVADAEENMPASVTNYSEELESGNMFNVVRDVADLQLKTGDYVEQLKITQDHLQQAVQDQNQQDIQTSINALRQQLTDFNRVLDSLDLRSQEIDNVREKIMSTNQQILELPYLNGQVDIHQADIKKIQQQMTSVQTEMLKLANMLLSQQGSTEKS